MNPDARKRFRLAVAMSVIAVMLAGMPALSQQGGDLATEKQKQQQEKAQHLDSGRLGTNEPSSLEPTVKPEHAAILVDGHLTVPGAPTDSQTIPAKFSKRNAMLDALPTMAFPLPLSDEDKQRIRVAANQAPVVRAQVHAADLLPLGLDVRELPAQVTAAVPITRNFGYVRTADRVLLVLPASRIVVGEIADGAASH